MTAAPGQEPVYGTFTGDAAETTRALHGWVRFAAILVGIAGTITLLATLGIAGYVSATMPKYRGLAAAVGVAQATGALAMLCLSFLLNRYSTKLHEAAEERRATLLMEAVPYETGCWMMVAAWCCSLILSLVLMATTPAVQREVVRFTPAGQSQRDERAEDMSVPDERLLGMTISAVILFVAGASLILNAAQRPKV